MNEGLRLWGWYPELGFHGKGDAGLADATLVEPQDHQDDIARYLLSGARVVTMRGFEVRDVLAPNQPTLTYPSVCTDGEWVWPDVIGYFVSQHNLRVPAEFVEHMRVNGWSPRKPEPNEMGAALKAMGGEVVPQPTSADLDALLAGEQD